jgi:hypothetical protein
MRRGLKFRETSSKKMQTDNVQDVDLAADINLPPHEATDSDEMSVHELVTPMFLQIMDNQR